MDLRKWDFGSALFDGDSAYGGGGGDGGGKVEAVRIPRSEWDGLCVVLPEGGGGKEGDEDVGRGWDVLVGLEDGAMERLKGGRMGEWAEVW